MLAMQQHYFSGGNSAGILTVEKRTGVRQIISALKIPAPKAVMILNGGTTSIYGSLRNQLQPLMTQLARAAIRHQITIVTGATDAGIFTLFGDALAAEGGPSAPVLGISPQVPVEQLEPHHTHFVMVAETTWGGETPLMYRLIKSLSRKCPSVAVFVGGGSITLKEMTYNVHQQRDMILISGSERSTDEVVRTRNGHITERNDIAYIVKEGRITAFDLQHPPAKLYDLIRQKLIDIRLPAN